MDAAYRAVHIEEDRTHWWFRGRLAVLQSVLRRALPRRPVHLLELGCGTGNVLGTLTDLGQAIGMEMNPELRAIAVAAGLDVRAGALPHDAVVEPGWADVVLLLDVIEHLDDDVAALVAAHRALRADGIVMITVPAYRWLWSAHDVRLGHRRRYTAARLRDVARTAGFRVERTTYFSTLMFPAVALVRLLKQLRRRGDHDLQRPPVLVNRAAAWLFGLERHLLRLSDLPFGSSILLLGRR
jgi:SAM-dependent methyltransferase